MIDQKWLEEMKRKLERKTQSDIDWVFMPKEPGRKIVVRVIPYKGKIAKEIIKHYTSEGSVNCLMNWGKECPLCKVVNNSQEDMVRRMRATPRYYYNVLVRRHDENPDIDKDRVYVMVSPKSVFWDVFRYVADEEYIIEDFFDPEKGYDVIIEKLPDNKYRVEASRKPSPIKDWDSIKGQIRDLDTLLPEYKDEFKTRVEEVASQLFNNITRLNIPTQSQRDNSGTGGGQMSDKPSCFGQYEGSTECLVCPHEVDCIKESNK